MRLALACLSLLALMALRANAQTPPDPLIEGRDLLAASGQTFLVPADQRNASVSITAGSHMELALDDGLGLVSIRSETAPEEIDLPLPDLSTTEETLVTAPSPSLTNAPGTVAFTLFVSQDQTLLKVQNNADARLAYIAVLFRGSEDDAQFRSTETCSVAAHRLTVESWPYAVDGLTIMRFLNPPDSKGTMCIDPTKDIDNPVWYSLDEQRHWAR